MKNNMADLKQMYFGLVEKLREITPHFSGILIAK